MVGRFFSELTVCKNWHQKFVILQLIDIDGFCCSFFFVNVSTAALQTGYSDHATLNLKMTKLFQQRTLNQSSAVFSFVTKEMT